MDCKHADRTALVPLTRVVRRLGGAALAMGLVAGAIAGLMAGLFGASVLGGATPSAIGAPEPDPVPRRWQLTVEPGPLRVASVEVAGIGPQMYYYLTYKVVNSTGQDLLFTPSFELTTDEGELVRSGRGVPAAATKAVLDRLENPFLQDQISIVGMLLQGEENAKEGLVMWPVGVGHVRALDVFASGFSGETRAVDAFDRETGGTKRVSVRKALMIRYQPKGETRPENEGYPVIEQRWVMR
jgi:hypothetical protein